MTEKEFEVEAQKACIKNWAYKKIKKLEKKLKRYAGIYFGEPIMIVYARTGAVIVHKDGSESIVKAGGDNEKIT